VKDKEIKSFEILKQKIVVQMQQSFPGLNPVISEWKGQDIVDFQEELLQKVNAHISEKWFYNHLKSGKETLPRIDILNLLSKYVGYSNWDDFRFQNTVQESQADYSKKANRIFVYVPLIVLCILGIFVVLFKMMSSGDYQFQFYDADTRLPVVNSIIEVKVLHEGESPVNYLCGPYGSFTVKTDKANIHFVVKSPYYKTDTIVRLLDKFNRKESVQLQPDNYAMMIQYFSGMNVKDWQKRRNQLNRIIADSAMIYQVFDREKIGVELFNKAEFIDKLTFPSTGLRRIEILDTQYRKNQISMIRFRQKETDK
jgi:hypothetical protein